MEILRNFRNFFYSTVYEIFPKPPTPKRRGILSGITEEDLDDKIRCISCGMVFNDQTQRVAHCLTEGHAIMKYVTGIGVDYFDDKDRDAIPRLLYCAICHVFHITQLYYERHLKDKIHEEMSLFLRVIDFHRRTIIVSDRSSFPSSAKDFQGLCSVPPSFCELCHVLCGGFNGLQVHMDSQQHKQLECQSKSCEFCNVLFANPEFYERHVKTDIHRRMENFMRKMQLTAREWNASHRRHCIPPPVPDHSTTTLRHFCVLCTVKFDSLVTFKKHLYIPTHRRLVQLVQSMNIRNVGTNIPYSKDAQIAYEMYHNVNFCTMCHVWLSNTIMHNDYEKHLESQFHKANQTAIDVELAYAAKMKANYPQ